MGKMTEKEENALDQPLYGFFFFFFWIYMEIYGPGVDVWLAVEDLLPTWCTLKHSVLE